MRTARGRPYVICHMCTSIDGRILGERWGRLPAGEHSGKLFERTAASFDVPAWLVGTKTMREFSGPNMRLPTVRTRIPRTDYIARPEAGSFAIAADARGALRFKRSDVNGDHVVLLITDRVTNDYVAHLRSAGVSYLFCGAIRVDLPKALSKLSRKLGLRKLMLEGGGIFNGAMLKQGLIDEISHITVPIVDGGVGIASLFDIPGRPPVRATAKLRPLSCRRLRGGIYWMRYRVVARPPGR